MQPAVLDYQINDISAGVPLSHANRKLSEKEVNKTAAAAAAMGAAEDERKGLRKVGIFKNVYAKIKS